MSSYNSLIRELQKILNGRENTDINIEMSDRSWKRIIDQARAKIIEKQSRSGRRINSEWVQTTELIKAEPVEVYTLMGNIPVGDENDNTQNIAVVLRNTLWKARVPEPLSFVYQNGIVSLDTYRDKTIPVVEEQNVKRVQADRIMAAKVIAYYREGYMYFNIPLDANEYMAMENLNNSTLIQAEYGGSPVFYYDSVDQLQKPLYQPFFKMTGVFKEPSSVRSFNYTDFTNIIEMNDKTDVLPYPSTAETDLINEALKILGVSMQTYRDRNPDEEIDAQNAQKSNRRSIAKS